MISILQFRFDRKTKESKFLKPVMTFSDIFNIIENLNMFSFSFFNDGLQHNIENGMIDHLILIKSMLQMNKFINIFSSSKLFCQQLQMSEMTFS